MNDLTKAAIKCSKCGKYRHHTEYMTALRQGDDPTKPVCDTCKDVTKSLAELDERIATLKPLLMKDVQALKKKRLLEEREKRIVGMVKAELTRRNTAQVVAETEKNRRKIKKLRRKADEVNLRKAEAEQMLADVLATQAAATAHLDELARRVDVVYTECSAGLWRSRQATGQ